VLLGGPGNGPVPFLQGAGDPIYEIVETPLGHNGIHIGFRANNWYALDISTEHIDFDFENNAYHIVVRGSGNPGSWVNISGGDSGWNWLLNTNVAPDGSFVVDGIISMDAMNATDTGHEQFMRVMRIQHEGLHDYTVYDITVVRIPIPMSTIYRLSHDEGVQAMEVGYMNTAGNVFGYGDGVSPYLMSAGDSWMATAIASPTGNVGFNVSFRTESWHAIDLHAASQLMDLANNEYFIAVIGRMDQPAGRTAILGGADPGWNWFYTATPDADGFFVIQGLVSYETINARTDGLGNFERSFRVSTNHQADYDLYEVLIVRLS
jgi:hypothetical protein